MLKCVFAGQNFIRSYWPYYLPECLETWFAGTVEDLALYTPQDNPGDALLTL